MFRPLRRGNKAATDCSDHGLCVGRRRRRRRPGAESDRRRTGRADRSVATTRRARAPPPFGRRSIKRSRGTAAHGRLRVAVLSAALMQRAPAGRAPPAPSGSVTRRWYRRTSITGPRARVCPPRSVLHMPRPSTRTLQASAAAPNRSVVSDSDC